MYSTINIENKTLMQTSCFLTCVTRSGEYHFENGDVYVGAWIDHRMEGKGKMMYANGAGEYEGRKKSTF